MHFAHSSRNNMQRQLQPIPLWMTVAALVAAVLLVVSLMLTLREETTFDDAGERAQQSSILPDDWSTYGADVWSIGYPNDWEIDSDRLGTGGPTTTLSLHFHPANAAEGEFVRVEVEARTLADIEEAFDAVPGVTRSEFRFAGYPAVKFSTSRRDEYFVSYNDVLYRIVTDFPRKDEVGIILATFKFIE